MTNYDLYRKSDVINFLRDTEIELVDKRKIFKKIRTICNEAKHCNDKKKIKSLFIEVAKLSDKGKET